MISWIAATFLVASFVIMVHILGLAKRTKDVINLAHYSVKVIGNSTLEEDQKEKALQENAIKLFRLFFILTAGGAMAVFLPLGFLWLCSLINIVSLESIFDIVFSIGFLIASGIFTVIAILLGQKFNNKTNGYSSLDRLLHRVAFWTYKTQIPIADIESQIFSKQLSVCKTDQPIFITSLPRAGTTLLLECCARLPDLAAHCYRDMPFVMTPYLWSRFSALFKQTSMLRERSHGDGILINLDSPEALEEVLWKTFWRSHYNNDRIRPWQNQENSEFQEFFSNHMQKIILLRRGKDAPTARYISKNNLNISRPWWLHQYFPSSTIVVPFREPLQHAASLLEQHCNFLEIHQKDPFASEYMRAIGHFDFGQNLRPIDFDNWLDKRIEKNTEDITFWLEYWVACYRFLLRAKVRILHFFDYQRLCEDPEQGLQNLADVIRTRFPEMLVSVAATIRPMRVRKVDTDTLPPSLLSEANDLYSGLKKIALN